MAWYLSGGKGRIEVSIFASTSSAVDKAATSWSYGQPAASIF
jgi:hypothetical protein